MGPYAFTQAALSGFFALAAILTLVVWLRTRRDLSLLILAIGSFCWCVQSVGVLMVASAETAEEAQFALTIRTGVGAFSIATLAWLFSEITGVRARRFLWFVFASMTAVSVAMALGFSLPGDVIGVERRQLPWGEMFTLALRTPPKVWAIPAYVVALLAMGFCLVCAVRFMRRDRMGGILLVIGGVGLAIATASAALIDLLRIKLPYLGMFGTAAGIMVIALQFARANRRRDEELATADRRFRAIFNQTFQFIGLMDVDGTILEANATALEFASVEPEDVIGKKFWDTPWWAHSSDLQERLRQAVRTARNGVAVRFEATHPARDGRLHYVDFSLKPVRDAHGAVTMLIPEGHDITERKEAEQALRASEERFRFLIQNQTEFVVSCKPDTTLTFVNESYCLYFGSAVDTIVGTRLIERVAPRDRDVLVRHIADLRPDDPVTSLECQVIAGSQDHRWTRWTMSAAFDDGGRLATLQMTGQDIHDRVAAEEAKRKLEQQLLQAQKMEALGQLAGGVAHDFNNLLTVIAGHADMLAVDADGKRARHDLEQIRLACERAASMTRQLLAFSRQSVLETKIVDMNAVVAQTETLLRRTIGEQIELTVRADAGLRPVKADPDQLSRVLLNMAINARDAMPNGGRLRIETRNVTVADRNGGRGTPGDYVMLAMSDTGTGISSESKSRLFEPFFTTKPHGKGTGLGLAVVDGIVKQSGGWIDVDSELNVGTTFQIFLPATEREAPEAPAIVGAGSPTRGTETVLLVEDERAVREMTQTALERFGYTVLSAASGEEAEQLLLSRRGGIDLLLTDVVMPGMSGPELAERVVRDYPAVPVIFMSGYTSDAVLRQGIETGEANFVQKPFQMAALAARVRQVLDRR